MVKMKMLNEYNMTNVPDHIREEFEVVLQENGGGDYTDRK